MLTLYESQVSGNCWKVRQLLAHRGLDYESVELSVVDRSNREAVLGGRNPALRVPTLILDDGRPLAESNAIMLYLAEGTGLIPDDAYERAVALQWLFFEQYSHEPYIAVARFKLQYAPDRPSQRELAALHAGGHRALRAMEQHLKAGREYFAGGAYSVADIALFAYTHVAEEGGFDLGDYPAIRVWLARVAMQPGHVPLIG